MSQKYLVALVHCADEYIDPQPEFAVIPVDADYIQSLIAKQAQVSSVPGLFLGEFSDYQADFIRFPDEDALPADLFERFQAAYNDGSYFLTEHDLSLEYLDEQDILVHHELPTVRFFGSADKPEAYFEGYIKHTGVSFETCAIDLEDVLRQLEPIVEETNR
jgi:hypothetical protein